MKRLILGSMIAIAVVATLPIASAQAANQPQPGRYQMVTSIDGSLHVLDTGTGQVWLQTRQGLWIDAGNPIKAVDHRAENPPTLNLPDKIVTLTIKQRQSKPIPGSDERVVLHLDDVTGNQVLVSIRADESDLLLDDVSAQQGDIIAFRVGGREHYVYIKELKNFLIGDDLVVLEIANSRKEFVIPRESEAVDESMPRDQEARTLPPEKVIEPLNSVFTALVSSLVTEIKENTGLSETWEFDLLDLLARDIKGIEEGELRGTLTTLLIKNDPSFVQPMTFVAQSRDGTATWRVSHLHGQVVRPLAVVTLTTVEHGELNFAEYWYEYDVAHGWRKLDSDERRVQPEP